VNEGALTTFTQQTGLFEERQVPGYLGGDVSGDGPDLAIAHLTAMLDQVENTQTGGIGEGVDQLGGSLQRSFGDGGSGGH